MSWFSRSGPGPPPKEEVANGGGRLGCWPNEVGWRREVLAECRARMGSPGRMSYFRMRFIRRPLVIRPSGSGHSAVAEVVGPHFHFKDSKVMVVKGCPRGCMAQGVVCGSDLLYFRVEGDESFVWVQKWSDLVKK
ncbi:hypothetical protein E3N88_06493 [Mikania micrantha]|uniref:Uncharacterized protein n=1 Tax=Mikania micrantha TaxID=192012 RepID=A0A5N6PQY8_9ASTR|nr:hypothetical protein E3N88_06493 [Mikania micrantha]